MNREVTQIATTLKPLAGEVNNIDYLVTPSMGVMY